MYRDCRVYLGDILEAIQRIREYVQGLSFDGFEGDSKTVDPVVRNLEVIGEAVKHLPDGLREEPPEIEWRKVAGLRDVLVHEYFGIDLEIVWDIVETKLDPLQQATERLLASRSSG